MLSFVRCRQKGCYSFSILISESLSWDMHVLSPPQCQYAYTFYRAKILTLVKEGENNSHRANTLTK